MGKDYLTDVLADKGVSFIRSAAARQAPFLLEIATFAPHSPFTPAPRDWLSFPGARARVGLRSGTASEMRALVR